MMQHLLVSRLKRISDGLAALEERQRQDQLVFTCRLLFQDIVERFGNEVIPPELQDAYGFCRYAAISSIVIRYPVTKDTYEEVAAELEAVPTPSRLDDVISKETRVYMSRWLRTLNH